MKHNLLSVSQMCDQGHKVTVDSQKCEIRKEGLGKLAATAARTSSNIYVLNIGGFHFTGMKTGGIHISNTPPPPPPVNGW
jgi:hypothetical protein